MVKLRKPRSRCWRSCSSAALALAFSRRAKEEDINTKKNRMSMYATLYPDEPSGSLAASRQKHPTEETNQGLHANWVQTLGPPGWRTSRRVCQDSSQYSIQHLEFMKIGDNRGIPFLIRTPIWYPEYRKPPYAKAMLRSVFFAWDPRAIPAIST